jgi:hypothetical protein
MPHAYKLHIRIEETDTTISLEGTLGDAEWELLEEFLACVDEMVKTRLVKDNMVSSLRLEGDESGIVRVAVKLPPWEDVQAFLHVFRPILLKKEATNFYKVCNLISREFSHSYFRGLVARQREMYNGKRLQEQFEIKSNDVLLNSEEVLQQWLNSYEFHHDKNKKTVIDSLHQLLPLEASKAIFLSLLTEKARAAINIGLIVRVILGKQKQVTGRLRRPDDK